MMSKEERKAYFKKYREDNKEHIKAYHKRYYKDNFEIIKANAKEYQKKYSKRDYERRKNSIDLTKYTVKGNLRQYNMPEDYGLKGREFIMWDILTISIKSYQCYINNNKIKNCYGRNKPPEAVSVDFMYPFIINEGYQMSLQNYQIFLSILGVLGIFLKLGNSYQLNFAYRKYSSKKHIKRTMFEMFKAKGLILKKPKTIVNAVM